MSFSSTAFKVTMLITLALVIGFIGLQRLTNQNIKEQITNNHTAKYKAVAETAANSITQLEKMNERLLINTLELFKLEDKNNGDDFTREQLIELRNKYQVSNLYYINNEGHFYRTTNNLLTNGKPTPWSIFKSNPEYKSLLSKSGHIEVTPLLWLRNYDTPAKFAMTRSVDGKKIIEVGISADLTGKVLKKIIEAYPEIKSLKISTPNNQVLGVIGKVPEGTKDILTITRNIKPEITHCIECFNKGSSNSTDDYFYKLELFVDTTPLLSTIKSEINKFTNLINAVMMAIIGIILFVGFKYLSELSTLKNKIVEVMRSGDLNSRIKTKSKDELSQITKSFNSMMEKLQGSHDKLIEAKIKRSRQDFIEDLAHDLRSPLKALENEIQMLENLDENQKGSIKLASKKIREILFKIEPRWGLDSIKNIEQKSYLLKDIIDTLINLKLSEYPNLTSLEIKVKYIDYGIFTNLNEMDFLRVLSNIINNSIEATDLSKPILIELSAKKKIGDFILEITDYGNGISKENIKKVFDKGYTKGKKNGTGHGLSSAKKFINSKSGEIYIDSELGMSTTVSIRLPLAKYPHWYISEVSLLKDSEVVIIDDDKRVHSSWDKKLNKFKDSIKVTHIYDPMEFSRWYQANQRENQVFLVDYQFSNKSETGADIIIGLGIERQSYLVTDSHNSINVWDFSRDCRVGIVPKTEVINLEFKVTEKLKSGTNFLDDDILLTYTSEMMAQKQGQEVNIYNSINDLISNLRITDRQSNFLIDLNIHNEKDGFWVCQYIYQIGFENIEIQTGDASIRDQAPRFIKNVTIK